MEASPCHSRAAPKNLEQHTADQAAFFDKELQPALDAAQAGQGHVFFVDAAHFVCGTFLCCLWSFTRLFVRAAAGRQRFNVLGAWNAVTRQLVAVTNTLLFLPSYSPNLNLSERLWKFIKRRALYGRYHPAFADFRAVIEQTIAEINTTHANDLASLMTLNFQRFENVSLMAA